VPRKKGSSSCAYFAVGSFAAKRESVGVVMGPTGNVRLMAA